MKVLFILLCNCYVNSSVCLATYHLERRHLSDNKFALDIDRMSIVNFLECKLTLTIDKLLKMDLRDIEFISTKRGGVAALHGGHKYHRKKKYTNGNTFWLCCNYNRGCHGSITLNEKNQVNSYNSHECLPNNEQNKVFKEIDKLKHATGSNFESIQKQYSEMVYKLESEGIHLMADIPPYENKKTGLFNNRNKILGVPKMRFPTSCAVVVPKKFQQTFLLADYFSEEDDKRILIFCNKNIRYLVKCFKHILCDGTFKSCPKVFKQIYTIHGYNEENTSVTPLIYCLLPDKTQKTYELLFQLIESNFRGWRPSKVTMDFEKSAMNAVRQVYPGIEVKGCYFHYNRCLFRKSKQLKISSPVKKRHVSRCAGIARLPPEFIASGIEYVMRRKPAGEDINRFNTYFRNQWLNNTDFEKTCCCSKERIRTTNNLEGWHSRINRFIGQKNVTVANLLDILIKETKVSNIFKTNCKKSNRYLEIDTEIDNAINDLQNGQITVGHCIEIISPYAFLF